MSTVRIVVGAPLVAVGLVLLAVGLGLMKGFSFAEDVFRKFQGSLNAA